MPVEVIQQEKYKITVQITVPFTSSMLQDEQALQNCLNEAGQAVMGPMIQQFDTQGEPIRIGGVKHTVKAFSPQT
jgi:hypothetical protein